MHTIRLPYVINNNWKKIKVSNSATMEDQTENRIQSVAQSFNNNNSKQRTHTHNRWAGDRERESKYIYHSQHFILLCQNLRRIWPLDMIFRYIWMKRVWRAVLLFDIHIIYICAVLLFCVYLCGYIHFCVICVCPPLLLSEFSFLGFLTCDTHTHRRSQLPHTNTRPYCVHALLY